jgi:hypothetical protein
MAQMVLTLLVASKTLGFLFGCWMGALPYNKSKLVTLLMHYLILCK